MNRKFVFVILFLIFLLGNVSALGITPGRTTLTFEPNLAQTIEFSVLNSNGKDMSVSLSVRGELAEYVSLDTSSAVFSSSESSKTFSYSVQLPANFDEPGTYEAEIVVTENSEDSETAGTTVGAVVGVATQLHVYVPYPDKYVEADLSVVDSGEAISFFVPTLNRGETDINNLQVFVDIYSGTEFIDTVQSDSRALGSLKRTEFVLNWEADVSPATYRAVARIVYDGETATKEIEFSVGELAMEVLEITIKDFQLGGIAKFNALVQNNWGDDLKNVYLNIIVYEDASTTLADFRSQVYEMPSLEQKTMVAYWDTEGVSEGTYDGKVVLRYGDAGEKAIENIVQIKVSEDSIEVLGLTGRVVDSSSGKFNLKNALIILVIVLLVGNIVWYIIYKRMKKKK